MVHSDKPLRLLIELPTFLTQGIVFFQSFSKAFFDLIVNNLNRLKPNGK
jgi:hypothetical protein